MAKLSLIGQTLFNRGKNSFTKNYAYLRHSG